MDLMICPKMSVRKQHALYVMTEHDLSTKFIDLPVQVLTLNLWHIQSELQISCLFVKYNENPNSFVNSRDKPNSQKGEPNGMS